MPNSKQAIAERRRLRLPNGRLEGQVCPGPFSDDGRPAPATIRKWLRLVARDAGRLFGEGSADREHVADFVYRHSLSVAWACRRLRRADVVLAIGALCEKAKVS
jgi:hypothetical protein